MTLRGFKSLDVNIQLELGKQPPEEADWTSASSPFSLIKLTSSFNSGDYQAKRPSSSRSGVNGAEYEVKT